jgi:hypothetical protein
MIIILNRAIFSLEIQNLPDTLAQSPSMASISLIKIPLPIPPNEGLQDISPFIVL